MMATMTATSFEACFREHYPRLVALGIAMSGSPEVARDLAQETMMRAHDRWDEIADYDAPGAWLRRVMSNLLIDHHRSRSAERRALRRLPVGRDTEPATEGPGEWATMLAVLPPRQRIVVALFYGEDLSIEAIAETLDIAAGTVKSSLGKARARLAEELEGTEVDDG